MEEPRTPENCRVLDSPIWSALNTEQSETALGGELARRFPSDIGPLSGLREQSDAAYEELRELSGDGGVVVQFLPQPLELLPGWELVRGDVMDQMVWQAGSDLHFNLPAHATLRELVAEDMNAMLDLAKLTAPGPFEVRTRELGRFFGVFEGQRLLAMAGQRLHLTGFTEVSAVCAHPGARGRGYARAVIARVVEDIVQRGETPMLHVLSSNTAAIRVYEGLGFTKRRTLNLAVLRAV